MEGPRLKQDLFSRKVKIDWLIYVFLASNRKFCCFPSGIAVSAERTLYFADGTAIRSVDTNGIIRTIVGRPANPIFGLQPAPCHSAVRPSQVNNSLSMLRKTGKLF